MCTISADRASEGSTGCFGKHITVSKCRINLPKWGDFWLIDTSAMSVYRDLPSEPLSKRAWRFQESALPFRNLHFGSQGLVWECQEVVTCQEVFEEAYGGHDCMTAKYFSRNLHHLANSPKEDVLENWSEVLENFSGRQITKEEDRFPALSGVVKRFEEMLEDTYIAGLWRSDLPLELLWYVESPESGRRTLTYVAPSWS